MVIQHRYEHDFTWIITIIPKWLIRRIKGKKLNYFNTIDFNTPIGTVKLKNSNLKITGKLEYGVNYMIFEKTRYPVMLMVTMRGFTFWRPYA